MTFLRLYWRWIALAALLAASAAFGAYRMHVHDQIAYNALRSEFDVFRGGVEALGKAAQEQAKATELANLERKRDADAKAVKAKRDLDGLYAAYTGLRDSRKGASRSLLSSPAPAPGSAATATFDRAAFDRAISDFDAGAVGILKQGDSAIVDLNSAKTWARK